jgi:2-methylcitrate dehydratase PrpD
MAGGLYEFRHEGSMLMALHGGWPASSGVTAAYLGNGGFTGPSTVLEGPEGFFRAFADTTRPELLLGGDGKFGVEEMSLRPYCACRYAHAGIDALGSIWRRHGRTDPEQISKVTVWTHRTAVDQETEPTSAVGARLSTRFNMAHAIVYGPRLTEIGPDDLTDSAVGAVSDVTAIREDPALSAMFPERWACRVAIELRDGTVYEEQVDTPKGEPANPLTPAEVESKFRRLAVPVLGEDGAESLRSAVAGLPEARDLSLLSHALAPALREEP